MAVSKQIIYYVGSRMDQRIGQIVRDQLNIMGLPIVSATLTPLDFGENHVVDMPHGVEAMFNQILTCLENATGDVIYFCEADVLYHPSHFDFTPPDNRWYYNHNWYKIGNGDKVVHWDADQVSGICVYRDTALPHYRKVVAEYSKETFNRKYEPLSGVGSQAWKSEYPNIDIRGNWNLTLHKWGLEDFRDKNSAVNFTEITIDKVPGWDKADILKLL